MTYHCTGSLELLLSMIFINRLTLTGNASYNCCLLDTFMHFFLENQQGQCFTISFFFLCSAVVAKCYLCFSLADDVVVVVGSARRVELAPYVQQQPELLCKA